MFNVVREETVQLFETFLLSVDITFNGKKLRKGVMPLTPHIVTYFDKNPFYGTQTERKGQFVHNCVDLTMLEKKLVHHHGQFQLIGSTGKIFYIKFL